jgi:hypothetical protein
VNFLAPWQHYVLGLFREGIAVDTPADPISAAKPTDLDVSPALPQVKRPSWKLLALALILAGVSDVFSFVFVLLLPVQWALDLTTAFLLFLIFGRRRAILPALIAEAIPGMGIFPVWILVVISIILYDDIKRRRS